AWCTTCWSWFAMHGLRRRSKGRKTPQPKPRRDEELKAGRSLDGVSRGGGLSPPAVSPPAEAPHREASGTRLWGGDRGGANRARPLRRPGINAGPGRLRPTPHEWDDDPPPGDRVPVSPN